MADSEERIKIEFETNADDTKKSVDGLNASIDVSIDENEKLASSQEKVSKSSKKQVDAISEIAPASTDAVKSLVSMGKAMWALVANPLGAVLTAIAVVIGVLFLAFKSFQPLVDKVEQSFAALVAVVNVIKNTFIGVVTGTKTLSDGMNGLGDAMDEAANRTIALTKAQQDLDDVMASQIVTSARNRAEINKLNVELKNRTKTDEERLAISNKIIKKENQDYLQRKAIVDQEVRNAREAIAIKAQFTKAEIKLLKETGDATKELAESRGGNYDEEYKALNDARLKAIDLENEVTVNLEKTYSKQDKIAEDQAEKIARRNEEAEKRRQEAKKAAEKRNADAVEAEKKRVDGILAERKRLNDESDEIASFVAQNEQKKEKDKKDKELLVEEERKKRQEQNLKELEENAKRQFEIEQGLLIQKQEIEDAKISIAERGIQLIAGIFGKSKAVQKGAIIAENAVGIGKMIIANNTANIGALATPQAIATSGAAAAPVIALNNISTGIGVATTIAATAKALKAVGGGGSAGSAPQLPSVRGASATPQTGFQASSENQIATSIASNKQDTPIVKAYVVAQDMTDQQAKDKKLVSDNSFGGIN